MKIYDEVINHINTVILKKSIYKLKDYGKEFYPIILLFNNATNLEIIRKKIGELYKEINNTKYELYKLKLLTSSNFDNNFYISLYINFNDFIINSLIYSLRFPKKINGIDKNLDLILKYGKEYFKYFKLLNDDKNNYEIYKEEIIQLLFDSKEVISNFKHASNLNNNLLYPNYLYFNNLIKIIKILKYKLDLEKY